MTRTLSLLLLISIACACNAQSPQLDVPYVPTPEPVVKKMLQMADVKEGDVVYDLGCGDGRIVITAVRDFGARGIGVDLDPERIADSNKNAQAANVADRVKFIEQDLFTMDFSDADVVAMYLLPSVNVKLRPTILEMRPGTRIVSHAFDMGDWEADEYAEVEGRSVYFWVVPAKADGTWTWEAPTPAGKQEVSMSVDQKYQTIKGTARIADQEYGIHDGKLRGDELSFTLRPIGGAEGATAMNYTGKIDGDTITGRMNAPAPGEARPAGARGNGTANGAEWTATRKAD